MQWYLKLMEVMKEIGLKKVRSERISMSKRQHWGEGGRANLCG